MRRKEVVLAHFLGGKSCDSGVGPESIGRHLESIATSRCLVDGSIGFYPIDSLAEAMVHLIALSADQAVPPDFVVELAIRRDHSSRQTSIAIEHVAILALGAYARCLEYTLRSIVYTLVQLQHIASSTRCAHSIADVLLAVQHSRTCIS